MVPEAVVDEVRRLRANSMSFSAIAVRTGRTRGSIAHIVWRYILGNGEKPRRSLQKRRPTTWADDNLTETWAERKARRAAERAAG